MIFGATILAAVTALPEMSTGIRVLLQYLRRHDLLVFMIYRLAVAALAIGLVVTNTRSGTI